MARRPKTRRVHRAVRLLPLLLLGALVTLAPWQTPGVGSEPAAAAAGDTQCPAGGCTVTVRAFKPANPNADPGVGVGLGKGDALPAYNFIVNADNSALPLGATEADGSAVAHLHANGYAHTESYSPIMREGGCSTLACNGPSDRQTVKLPTGRYLITVRAPDRKLWGQLITLPRDADSAGSLSADVVLTEASAAKPLPLGSNRVVVFNDNGSTNGAPDAGEQGLKGFKVKLFESTHSAVTVDYHNKPLCSDPRPNAPAPGNWPNCETDSDGFVQVDNLSPAGYFTQVVPPDGPCNSNANSQWIQTTTIDGGFDLYTPVAEGTDGSGPPTALAADLAGNGAKRTINWFGFVCGPVDIAQSGSGEITGTARNQRPWTNANDLTFGDRVENPWVSLTDVSTNETIYVGRGDSAGSFDIQGVPAGTYNVAVWDEPLSYIISFFTATVADGQTVDLNTTDSNGESGVAVPRWFGWLDGTVYKDKNNNGKYDAGVDQPIPNTDVDQRWRDGSIKETTFTDASGHYEYPTAEGGTLGKWIIGEQGFARFSAYPGPSLHDVNDPDNPDKVIPSCAVEPPAVPATTCLPTDQGGGLLTNQLLQPDHRATVDWGKRDYKAGTPGQIVGVTYFSTTRNEFQAALQAHEDYEPGIPDVTVYLEGPGPDGKPNTEDDVVLNKYVTDHWQGPTKSQDPQNPSGNIFSQSCSLRNSDGSDATSSASHWVSDLCVEQPITGVQTKDGAFDGGYAFADYCPESTGGYDLTKDDGTCADGSDPVDLQAGTYITHFVAPKDDSDSRACNTAAENPNVSTAKRAVPGGGTGCLFRPVKEEDVNVDLGAQFTPQVPPPPCVGDDHAIDKSTLTPRSPYFPQAGAHALLCDKKLVVLQNQQNANADFNLMTNFPTDPNGEDPSDTRIGDVQEPGRVWGISLNDLKFDTNPDSVLFGDNAGAPDLPVGIYARYDDNPQHWRLFTTVKTSDIGTYEAVLPSLETLNCPIPQGPCPGMYRFLVDDPGTPNHPNADYDPSYIRGTDYIFDVWPGQTNDSLDTPMIPATAGTKCQAPSGNPEVLQVSKPYVSATDTTAPSRRITIRGFAFGTTPGTVTLDDPRGAGQSRTLGPVVNANPTVAAGGIVSWTDTQIVLQVPAAAATFLPGQKQLSITQNGRTSDNGLTVHVRGTVGANTYNPTVVQVPAWNATTNRHAIQNALDSAAAGSLLVLSPGTYYESVVMWKPVKIQGLGPGGLLGAEDLQQTNPGDPRFNIPGSIIDGRFFGTYAGDWDATVTANRNPSGSWYQGAANLSAVLRGADVLALAKTTAAYAIPAGAAGVFSAARVDGVGLTAGGGNPGAGGVQLQANADNVQITNDVVESNSGTFAGGIGLGQPGAASGSHNFNVRIAFDRVLGNGAGEMTVAAPIAQAGGVGIFSGSQGYDVGNSVLCSNAVGEPDSPGFGGGLLHYGQSPSGAIHDNRIIFNRSIESGGGVALLSNAATGTGAVNLDRNVIQTNASGNDGGGLFVSGARTAQINVRNNMVNDNLANDMGGAIMLHDSTNVAIVNNTVANNTSTASPVIGGASTTPHSAGLAVDKNSSAFTAAPGYSRPSLLRNNIFWQNQAFTLSADAPLASLVEHGHLDFEVFGTGNHFDTLTPSFSDLTNGNILFGDGTTGSVPGGQNNRSGDPNFVSPFKVVLSVGATKADPTLTLVSIAGLDPPDETLLGDYHIALTGTTAQRIAQATNSPVIDRAPVFVSVNPPLVSPVVDFEGQVRPQIDTARLLTPFDIGADERPLTG